MYVCNTFTPQIKGIPEDTFGIPQYRETSHCTPAYIEMYPGKVVALPKEQATFIKARIDVDGMSQFIYTSLDNNRLLE